jgi:hypothetical protein
MCIVRARYASDGHRLECLRAGRYYLKSSEHADCATRLAIEYKLSVSCDTKVGLLTGLVSAFAKNA